MLAGHRVGLVTNQTGIDARGRRGIDLIANAAGIAGWITGGAQRPPASGAVVHIAIGYINLFAPRRGE